jgi:thermitase
MSSLRTVMCAALVTGGALVSTGGTSTSASPSAAQIVVRVAEGVDIDALNADYGTSTLDVMAEMPGTYLIATSPSSPLGFDAGAMASDPRVLWADPNEPIAVPEVDANRIFPWASSTPLAATTQYAGALLGLDIARPLATGLGVVVAVIDTGVQLQPSNASLAPVLVPGFDLLDDDGSPNDERNGLDDDGDGAIDESAGHGTHVAGIVHLVAPEARIMPIRVLDSDGTGTDWDVVRAMHIAAANGADVVNLSLGRRGSASLLRAATAALVEHGVVVVAAAGNDGRDRKQYPAASRCAIAVTSSGPTDALSTFSTTGSWVDVVAPGEQIVSTHPFVGEGFATSSGTSMSAPLVAGQAALILQLRPNLAPGDVHGAIRSTTAPVVGLPTEMAGVGRADVASSVRLASGTARIDAIAAGVDPHCLPPVP